MDFTSCPYEIVISGGVLISQSYTKIASRSGDMTAPMTRSMKLNIIIAGIAPTMKRFL